MATYCPKCNYKLRLRDYKPECPQCNVNLVYYGMEERLRAEADSAELEYAKSKPKYDRLKAATVGNNLAKARLALYILPLLATLLPLGKYALSLPFYEKAVTLNVVSIVQLISSFDFDLLIKMCGSEFFGKEFIFLTVSIATFLVMLVLCIVSMALLTLSCSPKGLKRNFTLNALGIILAVTSTVTFSMAASGLGSVIPSMGSVSFGWGMFGVIAAFLVCVATNVIHKVKGIEVPYTDVSEFFMPYEERPSTIAANAKREAERLEEAKKDLATASVKK